MFVAKSKVQTKEIIWLIVYFIVVFGSAIIRDFVIIPFQSTHIATVEAIWVEPLWKIFFWIIPTILYIHFIENKNVLEYLKLTKNLRAGFIWGFLGVLFWIITSFPRFFGHITFNFGADTWLNVIILVGFMEEIPFRGFLFQKLQDFMPDWVAGLVSSLLFTLIHIPLLIASNATWGLTTLLMLFIFAVICCYTFKKSKSLWSCIMIHVIYNILQNI